MSMHQVSRWNKIIILDAHKQPIDEYQLDRRAKLLTKLKRQRRRNLGKLTGKKSPIKDWKKNISTFEEILTEEKNFENNISPQNSMESNSENFNFYSVTPISEYSHSTSSNSDSSISDHDDQSKMSYNELISLDWLLNTHVPVSAA